VIAHKGNNFALRKKAGVILFVHSKGVWVEDLAFSCATYPLGATVAYAASPERVY
jgi:hypothetical protein